MSKYDAIRELLSAQSGSVAFDLDELTSAVPGGLPKSAFTYEAWWSNGDSTHPQSRSWGAAGYRAHPDLAHRRVEFRRH